MVDAEDLKSFGHCDRVGSSPTNPTTNFRYRAQRVRLRKLSVSAVAVQPTDRVIGCVAQLVRALRSHRRGRRFESAHIHQPLPRLRLAGHKN